MENELENELPSTAESVEQTTPEVENKPQNGEEGTPEVEETDEQKNARVVAEEAERARQRDEKRQSKINRRIDEITAEKHAERRRADELATQNQKLMELMAERLGGPKTSSDGAPQRDQYENYEDYLEAKALHTAERKFEERLAAYEQEQKKTAEVSNFQKTEREIADKFVSNRDALKKELPDYDDVVEDWEPTLPLNLQQMIVRLPEGPLISYHMAKNPALEAQFKGQPPELHGVILGQIVAQLKSPPKVTSAPPPGKTVSTSKSSSDGGDYSGPADGYLAWAKKNMK